MVTDMTNNPETPSEEYLQESDRPDNTQDSTSDHLSTSPRLRVLYRVVVKNTSASARLLKGVESIGLRSQVMRRLVPSKPISI